MKITLRDGSQCEDIKLGRLIQFDERSRGYPIRDVVGSRKPRSYTWRINRSLDQGPDGACVGFGVTHELCARPSEVQGLDAQFAKERIYWEAQKIDPWPGGSYPGADPSYDGTSILAGIKVAQRMGWFDAYRWAFSLDDLILGVGHNGPAVIGIYWTLNMFTPDSDGFISPTGPVMGGHCVLVTAVNIRKECFTIHNSWGEGWGRKGKAYVSIEHMGNLLNNHGEAAFFLGRHTKPVRR